MKRILFALVFIASVGTALPRAQSGVTLTVFVDVFRPEASPEGFVDAIDVKGLNDSASDLTSAFDDKDFKPEPGWPGSIEHYILAADPEHADLVLTVAARGTSTAELGSRTTMSVYKGVVTADTVPTVGVTRWVSVVLSVGTYRKEFLVWATNRSSFSMGAWTLDANQLAQNIVTWSMQNEAKLVERQKARGGPSLPPPPVRVGNGTDLPAPRRTTYVPPIYPAVAKAAGVTGSVAVDVTIDIRGNVIDAHVVQSVRTLDDAALTAVRQWRFEPPIVNGVARPVITTVSVAFAR